MKQVTDYYAVLGVDAHAPAEVIKKAFKHLALQYHPDIYKGEDAEDRMRELLLAYQTLIDPQSRRTYDLSRSEHMPGNSVPSEKHTDVPPTAHHDRQRSYAFPTLGEDAPAQIDLGAITYLLSSREVRRLKEQGMLRGAKAPSMTGTYYCHRCQHQWQTTSLPASCPNCQARDWREYLLLCCQHCHAVFDSKQIRDEVGSLHYGDGTLCPPYALFPLCPSCGKAQWCPAEEVRLWNVRDRAARRAKWRRRFGLE
ncbi:MAG TPA: DnaJ domain-containing protein [Ktedonobacteraceae bacterium]|nr:DnaJ domain-containing protein [Ktedonobacteraceae bacterium]